MEAPVRPMVAIDARALFWLVDDESYQYATSLLRVMLDAACIVRNDREAIAISRMRDGLALLREALECERRDGKL